MKTEKEGGGQEGVEANRGENGKEQRQRKEK